MLLFLIYALNPLVDILKLMFMSRSKLYFIVKVWPNISIFSQSVANSIKVEFAYANIYIERDQIFFPHGEFAFIIIAVNFSILLLTTCSLTYYKVNIFVYNLWLSKDPLILI